MDKREILQRISRGLQWETNRPSLRGLFNWTPSTPPNIHVEINTVCRKSGADPGEVKWVNFHPPPFFSEPPFSFFLSLQPGFGSMTLLQKFTPPPPPPFQNPGSAPESAPLPKKNPGSAPGKRKVVPFTRVIKIYYVLGLHRYNPLSNQCFKRG